MNDREDKYRLQAKDAQRQADAARSDSDKASWLQIAQGWLSMIRKRKRTAEESFNADVKAQDTQQEKSKSSH